MAAGVGFFIAHSKTRPLFFANSLLTPLPVFSLVALPFFVTGGGRAQSPLPLPSEVVRVHSFLQIKRKKTPMRLFSCWLVAPKKILFKLEPISMRRGVLLIAFKKLFGTV